MEKVYRVTPKNDKWIVQRIADRKTMHKPFRLKAEAAAYELELVAKVPQANGKSCKKTFFQTYEKFAAYKKDEALLREDLQSEDLEIGRMMKKLQN